MGYRLRSHEECRQKAYAINVCDCITVRPFPGGVFVKEPDSYRIVDDKVEMMTLEDWRHMFLKK